jgi:hypothetical protein
MCVAAKQFTIISFEIKSQIKGGIEMKAAILSKNGLGEVALNRRKAIHERCLNCLGWESHEGLKCPIADCYLYTFRTGNGEQSPKERSDAIKMHCRDCTNGKIRFCAAKYCPLFSFIKG